MDSQLPAHVSPAMPAYHSPRPKRPEQHRRISGLDIGDTDTDTDTNTTANTKPPTSLISPPASLITPSTTPPPTSPHNRDPSDDNDLPPLKRTKSIAVDTSDPSSDLPAPSLLESLPKVECLVRARIPTTSGREMFLHLYKNDLDTKEHLAIVFGPHIRSRSLDAIQPGETERDRMIRGAYVGRLYPGRTSSRLAGAGSGGGSGKASPLLKGMQKAKLQQSASEAVNAKEMLEQLPPPSETTELEIQPRIQDSTQTQKLKSSQIPLVRIHSECYTGETVWSARCDCGEQLDEAARLMSEGLPSSEESEPTSPEWSAATAGSTATSGTVRTTETEEDSDQDPGGVIIYLRQEGRGIGLGEKLKAYNLQDLGSDTYEANLLLRHPADARSYGLATAMLVDLGLGGERGIRLLTNNPDKIRAVEGPNKEVRVRERVAMVPIAWKTDGKAGVRSKEVEGYLRTKMDRFGHLLSKPA